MSIPNREGLNNYNKIDDYEDFHVSIPNREGLNGRHEHCKPGSTCVSIPNREGLNFAEPKLKIIPNTRVNSQ